MKTLLALAPLALLCGCLNTNPGSPLETDTVAEARCAAVREHVPFDERGTRDDPTVERSSQCVPGPRYVRSARSAADSPLYIPASAIDAATY